MQYLSTDYRVYFRYETPQKKDVKHEKYGVGKPQVATSTDLLLKVDEIVPYCSQISHTYSRLYVVRGDLNDAKNGYHRYRDHRQQ